MKGIILAGGSGTRLFPATLAINKHLLSVYDKPMIYYSISALMLAGIKDILIISTPGDLQQYQALLKDGAHWGVNISYAIQPSPDGLAQAFIIGEQFIGSDQVCLALGDNIFHGHQFSGLLNDAIKENDGATVFGYWVKNPERYGVLEIDEQGYVVDIEEKPKRAKSNYAVTGLYMYDPDVVAIAKTIKPSWRNELEVTDVNKVYLQQKRLKVKIMHRGFTWLDTGTHESLLEASQYVALLEHRQGMRIMCPEEVAWRQGFIGDEQLLSLGEKMKKSRYGQYLISLLQVGNIKSTREETV